MGGRAIIGHTGFVGSNLAAQQPYAHRFNSQNFRDMRGARFDEIACAGVQAVKWWANRNPEADRAGIADLSDVLATVSAGHFLLISTVDVYNDPTVVDEATLVPPDGEPYGRHRREFELFVESHFPNRTIVRLPALFGDGLGKNLIFDLLSGKPIDGFDARSTFQFYDLDRLSSDIEIARRAGLALVNFAVEPVTVAEIVQAISGADYRHRTDASPIAYDMRTRHAALWGRDGGYIQSKGDSLAQLAAFARRWREAAR